MNQQEELGMASQDAVQTPGPVSRVPGDDLFEYHLSCWSRVVYPELSVVLVRLKALAEVHKSHHWIAKGDTFYGDHLLFERLYDSVVGEVDTVAERAVMMGGADNVNVGLVAHQVAGCLETCAAYALPTPDQLAQRSLERETAFLSCLDTVGRFLSSRGVLTPGLNNMLEGIADQHEQHVYLLRQRLGGSSQGTRL